MGEEGDALNAFVLVERSLRIYAFKKYFIFDGAQTKFVIEV